MYKIVVWGTMPNGTLKMKIAHGDLMFAVGAEERVNGKVSYNHNHLERWMAPVR